VCNKDKNHYIDLPEEWLIAETEKLIADNKELFDRLAAS
jgi:hypothetical protein